MTPAEIAALRALCDAAMEVVGWPGYFVTPDGRVWSTVAWRGTGPREMAQADNGKGYLRVRMSRSGSRTSVSVHRIVADAFLGPRPSRSHQIRHLNGNRHDNGASNLAWGTSLENANDRAKHGTEATGRRNGAWTRPERRPRGATNGMTGRPDLVGLSKLAGKVSTVRQLIAAGASQSEVARRMRVNPSTINRIAKGKSWTTS